jgi:hypothetical protein
VALQLGWIRTRRSLRFDSANVRACSLQWEDEENLGDELYTLQPSDSPAAIALAHLTHDRSKHL